MPSTKNTSAKMTKKTSKKTSKKTKKVEAEHVDTTPETVADSTPAPVVETAPAPAPAKPAKKAKKAKKTAKGSKTSKSTKSAKTEESKVTPDTVDLTPTVTEPVAPAEPEVAAELEQPTNAEQMDTVFTGLMDQVKSMSAQLAELTRQLRTAQKNSQMLVRQMERQAKKSTRKKSAPSKVRYLISKELTDFLGEDDNCTMSRNEAESRIRAYIKEANIQNPENGREIVPDKKLSTICASGKKPFSYFGEFKKNFSHHFLQRIEPPVETSTVSQSS